MSLIERESELERIESLWRSAGRGRGAALLVEGAAGVGKTSLLDDACGDADGRGIRVLRARASALERELPFGVVRQLLEPLVLGAGEQERQRLLAGAARLAARPLGLDGSARDAGLPSPGAELHGLYWLCANACDQGPLALAVDDLHWADEASLRVLAYLVRRAAELPFAILATSRPVAAGSPIIRTLDGLWSEVLRLVPLSEDGVERFVVAELGDDAEREFCAVCARVTGGNPFLLVQATAVLRVEGIAPLAAEVDHLAGLGSVTRARAIVARLSRVGPDAVSVARALAVLGGDAALRRVAHLAGLAPEAAAAALDSLRRAGIAASGPQLELVHPLVRSAIVADLAEPAVGLAHLRAARLLLEEGEPTERVAAQLLAAEPSGERWVVETLREAAAAALTAGAPESAVALLRRALAEPPSAAVRAPLLAELGGALARAGHGEEGLRALVEAVELTRDPVRRAEIALELGPLVFGEPFAREALVALRSARDLLDDREPELTARLEATIAVARQVLGEPLSAFIGPLEATLRTAESPAARAPGLTAVAYSAALTSSRPAGEVLRLASEAAREVTAAADPGILSALGTVLPITGRPSAALPLLDEVIETAGRSGNSARFSAFSSVRARNHLRAGSVRAAEADAWAALAASDEPLTSVPFAVGVLLLALVVRGRLEEAERELAARGLAEAAEPSQFQDYALLQGRGALRLAQARPEDARADFLALGAWLTAAGITNPAFGEWRSLAALAYLALGETGPARRLAEEELELARRFGAPREVGIALRTLALADGGTDGLALLAESVSSLEGSEATLELGRSLVEHGAAIRRANRRHDAREPLRRGLDLARRCGAIPLATRARAELRLAGARPRRELLSGPDALTAGELRVARLAAVGHTNREIAQALFLTRRTVETHLTNTYRKLSIDTRRALPAALEADSAAAL